MRNESAIERLYRDAISGTLSRRTLLKRGAALGLSAPIIAGLLAACGGSSSSSSASSGSSSSSSAAGTAGSGTAATSSPGAAGSTPSASGSPGAGSLASVNPPASGPRGGAGQLNLLWWEAAVILNPHLASGTTDFDDSRIGLEPLADFDANGQLVPFLSDDTVPSQENGMVAADGMSVTWKLRQGVKWHDGQPFTADDVVFTYQYVSNPDTAATTSGSYLNVGSVDKIDDYTVKLNFKKKEPAWYQAFTDSNGMIIPKHLFQNYVGKNAQHAPNNLQLVGTGPYKLVSFKPGDQSQWTINTDYWDPGKPHFDSVIKKGGGDATSAARAVFQTGEADYAWNLQVAPDVLNAMKSNKGKLLTIPGGGTERLMLNHSDPNTTSNGQKSYYKVPHPHFKELAVRQAVAYLCDKGTIASKLYGAGGTATPYTDNSRTIWQPKDLSWEYNISKANALLDQAGATKGSGGIRTLNGRQMNWVYQTTVNQVRQETQEIIKASASQAGINITLKSIDASVYFSGSASNTETSGAFYADLEMYTNGAGFWPLNWYQRYLSEDPAVDICQQSNGWNGYNDLRYQNPAFNALYDQVAVELDETKQETLFQQMQDLVVKDVAEIGLVARNGVSAIASTITGDVPSEWESELWMLKNWNRSKA